MLNTNFEKHSVTYLANEISRIDRKTSLFITIHEASQILRTDKVKVELLIKINALKAINSSKGIKISKKSVEDFAEKLFSDEFPNNFKDKRIMDLYEPIHNYK